MRLNSSEVGWLQMRLTQGLRDVTEKPVFPISSWSPPRSWLSLRIKDGSQRSRLSFLAFVPNL